MARGSEDVEGLRRITERVTGTGGGRDIDVVLRHRGGNLAGALSRLQYLSKSLGDSDLSAAVTGVSLPLSTTISVNTVLGYIKEYPQMRE
jgi:hypothetical protein